MPRISLGLKALAIGVCLATPASAQDLGVVNAAFEAWSPGSSETMAGKIKINVLAFGGTVTSKTRTGVRCKGTVKVNLIFSGGDGEMRCEDGRKGTFTYALTSSLPPRGSGTGKMSTGEIVKFRITPD